MIQQHFKSLRYNRISEKKGQTGFSKTAVPAPAFKPQLNIDENSNLLAQKYRSKQQQIEINKSTKLEQLKKAKLDKEMSEVTLKPMTNKEMN